MRILLNVAKGNWISPVKIKEKDIHDMSNNGTPYIDHTGTVIIPFNADPKYHYWNGGQPLSDTLLELNAPEDVWRKHTLKPYPGNTALAGNVACGKVTI